MADLKPIGSEKLQGQEKLKRIIEISRYRESNSENMNETATPFYNRELSDGNLYSIVKERLGYVIKKSISESQSDYIEPMKNRRYYSSYSQALKRLNLIVSEVNRKNGVDEQTNLFGEQKKYVLKSPKTDDPSADDEAQPPAPQAPPPVPAPQLPDSPESGVPTEEPPMGDEEPPMGDEEAPMGDEEAPMGDEEAPMGGKNADEQGGEGVTFRMIQKLTGKLTQKIRDFDNEKGLTSENIKYVINMVLSAVDLSALSEEDVEDIMMKFEGGEEGTEEQGSEDMGSEEVPPTDETAPETAPETAEGYGAILDSIFGESKVDKVISKYFQVTDKEKRFVSESRTYRKNEIKNIVDKTMREVSRLSETIEQELSSKKFLEKNYKFNFVGKTNKNNLVFESKNKQVKISPEGYIL